MLAIGVDDFAPLIATTIADTSSPTRYYVPGMIYALSFSCWQRKDWELDGAKVQRTVQPQGHPSRTAGRWLNPSIC